HQCSYGRVHLHLVEYRTAEACALALLLFSSGLAAVPSNRETETATGGASYVVSSTKYKELESLWSGSHLALLGHYPMSHILSESSSDPLAKAFSCTSMLMMSRVCACIVYRGASLVPR